MDCIDTCKHGAIKLRRRTFSGISGKKDTENVPSSTSLENDKQIDSARRSFLSATALLAVTSVVKHSRRRWMEDLRSLKISRDLSVPHLYCQQAHCLHSILPGLARPASCAFRHVPMGCCALPPICIRLCSPRCHTSVVTAVRSATVVPRYVLRKPSLRLALLKVIHTHRPCSMD